MKPPVRVMVEDGRAVIEHTCADGETVTATLNNRDWTITQRDPLEVHPSIACDQCGLHGWIASGAFWTTGGPR